MSAQHNDFVSVIVPVNNPAIDVRRLVEGYCKAFEDSQHPFELIFVLDGVHGRVLRELEELGRDRPVKVVRLQGAGLGESIALSAGAARAKGAFIVNAPQYLQVEPDDLVKVVQALENGADLVATWRYPRVDPWLNRLQSRLFNWVLRVAMGIPFHDLNSGVRGMRRQVLDEVNVYGEMFRFLPVLAQRQGFEVVEIKVRHREEQGTLPFYGFGVYVRRVLDILAISFLTRFTQKPLRFFGILGMIAILLGIALSVEPLWTKIVQNESLANRPIFVLGVILIAFGVQLIGFGLVGEIVIFTQAGQLRDYKVEELVQSSSADAPATEPIDAAIAPVVSSNGAPVRVRELLPGEDARWDAFVRAHPQGTFFHLTGWRRAVEESFHHEPHYLICEQGRTWRGVLPVFWVRSPFIGKQMISLPYAVYGGMVASDHEAGEALIDAAAQQGRRLGASYLEMRHLEARPGERVRQDLYVTFRKRLPDDSSEVMGAIPKKARAEVRRARKAGMTFGDSTDLERFFRLFAEEKRRLGSPSLPLAWFQTLGEEFGRSVVLHAVQDPNGDTMCAVMSFLFRDTVYAYYSGSSIEGRGKGVADFMYCCLMEWAVEKGYRQFDFGRSRRDTGAARFKKNMGFEAESLHYEFALLRSEARLPEFHPSNPKLDGPRKMWSRLPSFVTNRVGGRLSRYLP